jgi:hypothetical protein
MAQPFLPLPCLPSRSIPVQSLETTATYNPNTRTFDLHSPNIGSTKWWPAALGRTATHAIIHARLRLPPVAGTEGDVRDIGVKPFFVQVGRRQERALESALESALLPTAVSLRCAFIVCEKGLRGHCTTAGQRPSSHAKPIRDRDKPIHNLLCHLRVDC